MLFLCNCVWSSRATSSIEFSRQNNEWTLHKQNFINKYAIDLWPHCYSSSYSVVNPRINCLNLQRVLTVWWFWRRQKCRCDWSQEDRRLFYCKHFVFVQFVVIFQVIIFFKKIVSICFLINDYFLIIFKAYQHFFKILFCLKIQFEVQTLPNFYPFMKKACRSDLSAICRNSENPQIFVGPALVGFRRWTCHTFVALLDAKQIKKQLETRGHVCELIKYTRLHKQ